MAQSDQPSGETFGAEAEDKLIWLFNREAGGPSLQQSAVLIIGGGAVAFSYTVLLTVWGEAASAGWVEALQPVADLISYVVPGVRWVSADLVQRGFAARAPYVMHVYAAQWLIPAFFFAVSAVMAWPERVRFRRGFAAMRKMRLGFTGFSRWRVYLLVVTWVAVLMVWPFIGQSQITKGTRFNFDLAISNWGLFPYSAATSPWWLLLFFAYLRLLGAVAPRVP